MKKHKHLLSTCAVTKTDSVTITSLSILQKCMNFCFGSYVCTCVICWTFLLYFFLWHSISSYLPSSSLFVVSYHLDAILFVVQFFESIFVLFSINSHSNGDSRKTTSFTHIIINIIIIIILIVFFGIDVIKKYLGVLFSVYVFADKWQYWQTNNKLLYLRIFSRNYFVVNFFFALKFFV